MIKLVKNEEKPVELKIGEQPLQGESYVLASVEEDTRKKFGAISEIKDNESISVRVGFGTYQEAFQAQSLLADNLEKRFPNQEYNIETKETPGEKAVILVLTSEDKNAVEELKKNFSPEEYTTENAFRTLCGEANEIMSTPEKFTKVLYGVSELRLENDEQFNKRKQAVRGYNLLLKDNPILHSKEEFLKSAKSTFLDLIKELPEFNVDSGEYAQTSKKIQR